MSAVKKQDVVPRAFPAQSDQIQYPASSLKVGNPLYTTSSMSHGAA